MPDATSCVGQSLPARNAGDLQPALSRERPILGEAAPQDHTRPQTGIVQLRTIILEPRSHRPVDARAV